MKRILEAMDIAGWEKMYRSGERGQEEAPTPLLAEIVARVAPGAAIDLACGAGRHALYLAERGWRVTAVDGSATAIQKLKERAAQRGLSLQAEAVDLTAAGFSLPEKTFDLVVIAYYLQRDLFARVRPALRSGGLVLAIVHTPEPGEKPSEKRAAPGELRRMFEGCAILHYYEGPSLDPAHKRPVAEIVARVP